MRIVEFAMTVDFKLYLITDRKQVKMPLAAAVRLALEGGVRAVQLREKDLPIREMILLCSRAEGHYKRVWRQAIH